MDEQSCPRCKTTSYRNKNLKLLVNACGHKLCQTCVDVLFSRPSAACPQCNTPLRRSDFRVQQFEDATVEREVDIRKRILKIYNKRNEDFDSLRSYNDYLEDVENIIFNLASKINVEETKKTIEIYKRENEKTIRKNHSKASQEEVLLRASLESEKLGAEEKRKQFILQQKDQQKQKLKDKESLINDLIYANAPAEEVIARHLHVKRQQKQEESERKSFFFSEKNTLKGMGQLTNQPVIEIPVYEYIAPTFSWYGPSPPNDEDIRHKGYLRHIRAASESEKAGGYSEVIGCRRAIQEAFDCLYL